MKQFLLVLVSAFILTSCSEPVSNDSGSTQVTKLYGEFVSPPSSARPGTYWTFMDGNQDRDEMEADLKAMARVGIRSVLMFEVNLGMPRGPVDFMSEEWQDNFAFAVKTAETLGMEVVLITGPGWTGSGGPWVGPEQSMQHLVGGSTLVTGPTAFIGKLDVPEPPMPNFFAGMDAHWLKVRDAWYEDVSVLAFPTPKDAAAFDQKDLKTLKETQPYSIWKHVPRYVKSQAGYVEPAKGSVIDQSKIIDLTAKMDVDGSLDWDVPAGDWTVMRFVSRSTGQTTRPAPTPGHGFETDKFSKQAYLDHWDNYQGKLLKKVKPGKDGKGWTRVHLDSWEMSSQNWSQEFRDEFKARRGYDPTPFFPAYTGMVVDSLEKTERFLWDLRKIAQELVIENYAGTIKSKAHEFGMQYSNQPYDMNPAGNLDLGSVADIPSCEFWDYRNSDLVDSLYSCIEATSIAHTMGKPKITAESFTSITPVRFHAYPAQMKNQTDWALAFGVNSFVVTLFQHQPLGDAFKPGMSLGPHGTNWQRNQNWWDMLPVYHDYISRASHILQQGVTVADILYLTPEGAPHIFLPPADALVGEGVLKDKRGYAFDAVSPRILTHNASVEKGRIAFKNASAYKIMVLPKGDTMTPQTLETILKLVEAGATIVGNPPLKSPSLVNYPASDIRVTTLAAKLWGSTAVPAALSKRHYGAGTIYWGQGIYDKEVDKEEFYPAFENTSKMLAKMGLAEDFQAAGAPIRFTHRRTNNQDIYFVSNSSDSSVEVEANFRVSDLVPELWDPKTGKRRALPQYIKGTDNTSVPLTFGPYESYFVIFSSKGIGVPTGNENFPAFETVMTIDGSWEVAFDTRRGGPENLTFETLTDWKDHAERGVKYYSGKATYTKSFDLPQGADLTTAYSIDLGKAYEMARVTLNGEELGVVWTSPWRVPAGKALKAKGNILTVVVANAWENRLIGDTMPQDKDARTVSWKSGLLEGKEYKTGRYTFTTYENKTSDFAAKQSKAPLLQPSGLIGPVRLVRKE